MELVLTAALVVAAIGIVWFVSQLGFFWAVFALILSLGALIFIILRQRAAVREEHLYDQTPSVTSIRQPLTPMEYSYRSNLDIPFFSFESQNYGKKTPRKRVRGIPIDRFIEFESRTETLLEEMRALRTQMDSMHQRLVTESPERLDSSTAPSSNATTAQTANPATSSNFDVTRAAQPRFDTTATTQPKKFKEQIQRLQTEFRLPLTKRTRVANRPSNQPRRPSIFDEIGNLCGSCGGPLKNYQCVDRCDPLSQ
jgi:hypothetical protein